MLVGHSYGGSVITNASMGAPNVRALEFFHEQFCADLTPPPAGAHGAESASARSTPDLAGGRSSSVAEAVEEPAEDAAFPGEGGAGRRCHGPLASDRLVIVCPGDSVNDLGLVELLGAVDLRHVANQHAVAHDLGFEARGTVGIPLGFAAAGQGYANAELAHATSEKVSVNATVTKGIDHPAGPEFVHARKLAPAAE